MDRLDPSVLQSRSFSHQPDTFGWSEADVKDSLRHANALIGTPGNPSLFAALARLPLQKEPFAPNDCPPPLPQFTQSIVFTTARRGIPYADAFLSFWETFRPDIPEDQLPRLEIVDPSIHKGYSEDYQATVEAQNERLRQLAEDSPAETIVYVFDEYVAMGRALRRGMQIVKEAGFSHVSQLPLDSWFDEGDGIYIRGIDLPFDREGPRNELVPNEDSAAVEALRHDMRLFGELAARNYLEHASSDS